MSKIKRPLYGTSFWEGWLTFLLTEKPNRQNEDKLFKAWSCGWQSARKIKA